MDLNEYIRDIPDFPKPGIIFKDITPLLGQPEAFKASTDAMAAPYHDVELDAVVGIESRGFIFGAAIAQSVGCGFVPIRKPGKLPADTISVSYELEYGEDTVEIHRDAVGEGDRVLLVDDVLATGGTMAAACELIRETGASIAGLVFLVELSFLDGRARLDGEDIHSVLTY
ncbi:TPA: adenine phosphoribosyltransferase [Candidatus Latescibacteria bacterium]|nr:adenine phosphoribosyltransferase [Candidatus Latescibacterota bacterium]